jgi:hypothetical protein
MSNSIDLASAAMQIIGALYAIFIAVVILGIQTIPTIGNINSEIINQKFYNDVTEKIPKFQTLNLVLAYLVLAVEFSCGVYIYYISGPTLILFALYSLFIVAIIYIIYISYNLIDYLLLAVTGKYIEFNVRKFEWIKKLDIFKVITLFASVFIAIGSYPLVQSYGTVNLLSAIASFFIGFITYVISNFTFK